MVHCGLVYVGETGKSLGSRISGHRASIQNKGQSLLHRHFHQPNHSVDDMRAQNLEKIKCSPDQAELSTLFRRDRELFWIKELGTAKFYCFNDQVKGVGTLSSPFIKKRSMYTAYLTTKVEEKDLMAKDITTRKPLSKSLVWHW